MKRKAVIAIVAAIALAAAGYAVIKGLKHRNNGLMALSGNIEVVEVDSGFKTAGRIESLSVDEGMTVAKGAVLAKLESVELANIVNQNKAAVEEAKARLAELKAGARPQEKKQAQSSVDFAAAELEKAVKDFDRAKELYESGAISSQKMDEAKKGIEMAESAHQKALEAQSLVKEGARKETIAATDGRLKQAEAALEVSQTRLNDTTLVSPISGVILKRYAETGEIFAAGAPVFKIGDLENPWVKVYVKESSLGAVKLGQKAEVRVDTYPGKVYEGTVSQISSEAEFTPKNIQTKEERVKLVFGVKIAVKNQNGELKPGMPADVVILQNE